MEGFGASLVFVVARSGGRSVVEISHVLAKKLTCGPAGTDLPPFVAEPGDG
jgi:hypothetical protein